jgi:hypothetical protein
VKSNADATIYQQVIDITYEYLGPVSERFVARGVKSYIRKKPQDLTKTDVVKLAEWSKLAIAMLTDDKKIINNYNKSILALAGHRPK